jgi:hypothetical protein
VRFFMMVGFAERSGADAERMLDDERSRLLLPTEPAVRAFVVGLMAMNITPSATAGSEKTIELDSIATAMIRLASVLALKISGDVAVRPMLLACIKTSPSRTQHRCYEREIERHRYEPGILQTAVHRLTRWPLSPW